MKIIFKKLIITSIVLILIGVIIVLMNSSNSSQIELKNLSIKKPSVAGQFYPSNKQELNKELNNFLQGEQIKNVKAIIVPHAGIVYSGLTAGKTFNTINQKFSKVIVLAPSHYGFFKGASILNTSFFETPLGLIKISRESKKLINDLKKQELFYDDNSVFEKEHAIEVELLFLQKKLKKFEIIPVLIGANNSFNELKKISEILKKIVDEDTLIVVSSDFTHFGKNYGYTPFNENVELNIGLIDDATIELIKGLKAKEFFEFSEKTTICGRYPITVLLLMLENQGLRVKVIDYTQSGQLLNDFENSVSYAGIVFSKPSEQESFNEKEKKEMEEIVFETIKQFFNNKTIKIVENNYSKKLLEKKACFVTLTKNNNLRGCIGHLKAIKPLIECIQENALNAAFHDPRFTPLTREELGEIKIEVSVLSKPRELEYKSIPELLIKLNKNNDGVILIHENNSSTFLPSVWSQIPDKIDFLNNLCTKQGKQQHCWLEKNTQILTYEKENK